MPPKARDPDIQSRIDDLVAGNCPDPFAILGRHKAPRGEIIRVFYPDALEVELIVYDGAAQTPKSMKMLDPRGIYAAPIAKGKPYSLRIRWADGWQETHDPYSFGCLLGDLDLYLLSEGTHHQVDQMLGAHVMTIDGVSGVRFTVWAPNARRVSVIGDFNIWDGRRHPMRLRHGAGVWELFIPEITPGERYKYDIMAQDGSLLPPKADPYARATELPPATASVVADPNPFIWTDENWMADRAFVQGKNAPLSIYELHVSSWRQPHNGQNFTTWGQLADALIPYLQDLGFTHLELMPISEYPFLGSWGYQPLSMYAPTARFGRPDEFAAFVDRCHNAGIGVLIDWVPAHFPADAHGLALFDGTHLYEHGDPSEGYHQDWHTLIYNFGRNEVRAFLVGSALHWIRHFHIDGLRVDAVASMLYRDYSRKEGEWRPNIYGGRENLEAVGFIRGLSSALEELYPDALLIAEESTSWPGVTAPTEFNGLGFTYKWNMGWMHDTLRYMQRDPLWRGHHAQDITFGMVYARSERFILPLSHDEVVHGKGSLLSRMPGDDWQKHANLRLYYALMWAYPGRKLLFMGGELAQPEEWNYEGELAWYRLDDPLGRGAHATIRSLNELYRGFPALHAQDDVDGNFRWLIADDRQNSVFAWLRQMEGERTVLVVCNATPIPREGYRIGVPHAGTWQEILNTDAGYFGGSNMGNSGHLLSGDVPSHGFEISLTLTLPPLSTLYFAFSPKDE